MEQSQPIKITDVVLEETHLENDGTPPEDEIITTLIGGKELEKKIVPKPPRKKSRIYDTLPTSSYSSLMPYQVPQVREILKICFPQECKKIVDTTAHIGGDSILFAETFTKAKIISIDVDPDAVACLKRNIDKFATPSQFEVICENSIKWIYEKDTKNEEKSDKADFYYFDPPWGGPRYYSKKEISLSLDGIHIETVINSVFMLGLSDHVLLKVPRNFAYPFFKSMVKGTCKLYYIKKPQKNDAIAYGLILISKELIT